MADTQADELPFDTEASSAEAPEVAEAQPGEHDPVSQAVEVPEPAPAEEPQPEPAPDAPEAEPVPAEESEPAPAEESAPEPATQPEPEPEPAPVPAEESEVAQAAAAPIAQPAPAEEALQPTEVASGHPGVPWWPFLAYLGVWVVVLGLSVYFLAQSPSDLAIFERQIYGAVVLAGLVLTAIGVLMIPAVWLIVRSSAPKEQRRGLFTDTLVKGAIATFSGVLMWWGVLVALDFMRTGRFL